MHRYRWLLILTLAVAAAGSAPRPCPGSDPTASGDAADLQARLVQEFGRLRIKAKGKPKTLPFDAVDRRLQAVADRHAALVTARGDAEPAAAPVRLTFAELFAPDRDDCFVALSNTVIRLMPESALGELPICSADGQPVGTFSNKYTYSRAAASSYTLHFFQYKTPEGRLHKTGPDLLLDRFRVRWADVRDRLCLELPAGD
jgi:hypothetical protein